MVRRVTFEGRPYTFPDDATDQEIAGALQQHAPAPPPPPPSPTIAQTAADVGLSAAQGAQNIPGIVLGTPGDIGRMWEQFVVEPSAQAAHAFAGAVGPFLSQHGVRLSAWDNPQTEAAGRAHAAHVQTDMAAHPNPHLQLPGSQDINAAASDITGFRHEPTTPAGQYARTAVEFLPAALGDEASLATRAARVAVPAVASETAGQVTHGTPLEGPARFAAALAGGKLNEAGVAANVDRAAARAASAASRPLENEFGALTAGERSGNPRQRQEEDDWRRGIGSDQAQRTLQAFDDRRAPEIAQNVMSIATRGQPPLTEDIGAAGTTLADTLRTKLDDMRAQQGALYKKAFDLAESEPVAPTDELGVNVDNVINEHFLDAGPSRAIIGRLESDIQRGTANYGRIERARQALNRELGKAIKSGDDPGAFAVSSIIDELDAFAAPRLSTEARRAITEARGLTHEMLNTFGQRQRTDLQTGHVGRADPGGRAIERVINTDLTGEQIIDQILGSSSKPGQQTLGAVQRIKDEATQTIQYRNANAPSGVRVPGRTRVGGQTAGQRRFNADDPNAPNGAELPKDELQALREGLFHRILRPLRPVEVGGPRKAGDTLPAQTVVTNLQRALNGPGKEITAIMFTARERAGMQRALDYLQRIVPPSGTAVSGTSPAIFRAVMGAFDKLVGLIPGVGPALRAASENALTTGAARNAIKPPGPLGAQPRNAPSRPSRVAPFVAGAIGPRAGQPQPQQQPRPGRIRTANANPATMQTLQSIEDAAARGDYSVAQRALSDAAWRQQLANDLGDAGAAQLIQKIQQLANSGASAGGAIRRLAPSSAAATP